MTALKSMFKKHKLIAICFAVILVLAITIGATLSLLNKQSNSLVNTFTGASVSAKVIEDFNGYIKKNVSVKNDGKQVIEVIAECIQAGVDEAVEDAWDVTVKSGIITLD